MDSHPATKDQEHRKRLPRQSVWKRLHDFNLYRRIREILLKGYLRRIASLSDPEAVTSWQPLYYIALKVAIAALILVKLYGFSPVLGEWLEKGFRFFKFSEIYNFQFPGRSFFDRIARILVLLVLGYYGLYFLVYQIQALCSSFVISKRDGKIYYIRSYLIKKDLYIFSIPEIDLVILKQNILFRLLGIGTIVLNKKNGDQVSVQALKNVKKIMKEISFKRT